MGRETAVQIFGQTFSVNAELEPEYLQRLAAHVDEKLSSLSEGNRMMDRTKVAVLAAFTIADELYRAKEEVESLREEIAAGQEIMKEQVERCLGAVELALVLEGEEDKSGSDGME
jgi:cell division protein ZapA